MKRSLFVAIALSVFFSCKKQSIIIKDQSSDTVKTNPPVNPTQPANNQISFGVKVLDRGCDVAVLEWTKPKTLDTTNTITYNIVIGHDTLLYNQVRLPYFLTKIDTIAYHGKVIATDIKGKTAIDTFYVPKFSGSYYAYSYQDSRLKRIGIGYYAPEEWNLFTSYAMPFDRAYATLPVLNRDTMFIINQGNSLSALNAKTGAEIWRMELSPNIGAFFSLLYHAGTIYLTGYDGVKQTLSAIDSRTHKLKWRYADVKPSGNLYAITDPIITKKTLYYSSDELMIAVDAQTGAKKWEFTSPGQTPAMSRAATDGNNIYFASQGSLLYSLQAQTGTVNWRTPTTGFADLNDITSVHNGVVIYHQTDRTTAYSAQNGAILWTVPASTLPTFNGDTVFIGYNNKVHALNIRTGGQIWQTSLPKYDNRGEMMVMENTVFAGYSGSDPSVNDAESGRNSYRLQSSTGKPYLLDGTPAQDYLHLKIFPIFTINGKTYYDASSSMSRSF